MRFKVGDKVLCKDGKVYTVDHAKMIQGMQFCSISINLRYYIDPGDGGERYDSNRGSVYPYGSTNEMDSWIPEYALEAVNESK